jgi:protein arginine kinase activator
MLCDRCGEREAVIHLTQIKDNAVTTAHLCKQCASEEGVQVDGPAAQLPLSGFLGSTGAIGAVLAEGEDLGTCSFCGASLKDFRETGRLGCAYCYAEFETQIRELLRRIHGASMHVGRPYLGAVPPEGEDAPKVLAGLRERLKRAVEAENFELAAELRDRIRGLE